MHQLTNEFVRYELTEAETVEGYSFTVAQRAVLQNLLADAATSKVNLTFDPLNPTNFAQQEAEIVGQIGILKHLLSNLENLAEQSAN